MGIFDKRNHKKLLKYIEEADDEQEIHATHGEVILVARFWTQRSAPGHAQVSTCPPQGVAHEGDQRAELDEGHDRAAIVLRVDVEIDSSCDAKFGEHPVDGIADQVEDPEAESDLLMGEIGETHHGETDVDSEGLHVGDDEQARRQQHLRDEEIGRASCRERV